MQPPEGAVASTDPRVVRFLDRGASTGMRKASVVRILFVAVFGIGALLPVVINARDVGWLAPMLALLVIGAVAYVAHISITRADRRGVRRLLGGTRPWSAHERNTSSQQDVQVQAAGGRRDLVTEQMTVHTMHFAGGKRLRLHPATQTLIGELLLYGHVAKAAARGESIPEAALPAIERALQATRPGAALPFAALGVVVLASVILVPYSLSRLVGAGDSRAHLADIRQLRAQGFTNDQAGEILSLEDDGMSREQAVHTVRAGSDVVAVSEAAPTPVRVDELTLEMLTGLIPQRGLTITEGARTEARGLVTRIGVEDSPAGAAYTLSLTSSDGERYVPEGAGPETARACKGMADHVVCATGEGAGLLCDYELGFDSGADVARILSTEHDYRVGEPSEAETHGGYEAYAMLARRGGVNVPVYVVSWAERVASEDVAAREAFGTAIIVERTSASGPTPEALLTRLLGR